MMYFIHKILTYMFRAGIPAIFRVMFLVQKYSFGELCHSHPILITI